MTIPDVFCWTRFGVEAGQDVAAILARKDAERRDNGGIFLWGIGNSVLPSLPALLAACDRPRVIFSPIRSRPRSVDTDPAAVAVWTHARTPNGTAWSLPAHSLVTSHAERASGHHFALVCHSDHALRISEDGPTLAMSRLRNLRSSRPVGSSQVTAIVRYRSPHDGPNHARADDDDLEYSATMIVDLAPPYVVILEAPVVVYTVGRMGDDLLEACWTNYRRARISNPRAHQYDLFEASCTTNEGERVVSDSFSRQPPDIWS